MDSRVEGKTLSELFENIYGTDVEIDDEEDDAWADRLQEEFVEYFSEFDREDLLYSNMVVWVKQKLGLRRLQSDAFRIACEDSDACMDYVRERFEDISDGRWLDKVRELAKEYFSQ
jgi:hypothetical protein